MHKALPLDQQLCFSIYAVQHAFTKFYKPLLEPLGLTYPQYLVLLCLWEEDQQSLGMVGERLGLDSGTLTPLLKRMGAGGFVRRVRDVANERRVVVSLTDKARELEQTAAQFPSAIPNSTGTSVADVAELRSTLFRLRSALQLAA